MKFFNTLSGKKEAFTPLKDGIVSMYVCGPTVYDVGHLGHARSGVSFDLIRRYLIYRGFEVQFVSNVTDVEDKMIKRAREMGITEKELAERIIPEYTKDYDALNVLRPTKQPRATDYIPQMVEMIEVLLQRGVAYVTDDGVYFEVNKFLGYGKLSHQNVEELRAGARIEVDEKKRNPEDFALWKAAKPGEPAWKGPHGIEGRPGWHIECSAMSRAIFGEKFDIHGGGIDLKFPHHEDEIAQSEMAAENPSAKNLFAQYWLHNGHIRINSEKMSKSLGNFFTIKEVLAKYHPQVVRYFLLSTQYRMPIDFSDDLLQQAKNSLDRLHDFMRRLKQYSRPSGDGAIKTADIGKLIHTTKRHFEKAMDEDCEIVQALAAIFDFLREVNRAVDAGTLSLADRDAAFALMNSFDTVLGVLELPELLDGSVEKMIQERDHARKNKNFKRSDEIRDELKARGIELEDTPNGTIWKKNLS